MVYTPPHYLRTPSPPPKWTHSIVAATWNDMENLESLAATSSRSSGLTNALLTNSNSNKAIPTDTKNNKNAILGNDKKNHSSSNPSLRNAAHTRHNLGHYIYCQALFNQENPPYHSKVIKAVNHMTEEIEACAWLQYVPSPSSSASTAPFTSSSAAPAAMGGTDVGQPTNKKKTTPQPQGQSRENPNDLPTFINPIEWRKQENWKRARIADMLRKFQLNASREGYYLLCNLSHSPTPPGYAAADSLLARVKVMDPLRAIIALPRGQDRWLFLQFPWRKAGEYGFYRVGEKAEKARIEEEAEVWLDFVACLSGHL